MKIYVYRNADGQQVDAIEGTDSTDCERKAAEKWGTDDHHSSFNDAPVSHPMKGPAEFAKRGLGAEPLKTPDESVED
jgi:hypothetical protein